MKRRAETYTSCAEAIIKYALQRRGRLFVDIDNTVNDAANRIQRAALPSWPGETFDSSQAFSAFELAKDSPLPGAVGALRRLGREWHITFLSARGYPHTLEPTVQWLQRHGFFGPTVLVSDPLDKIAWLHDAAKQTCNENQRVVLIDDLSKNHHQAVTELDTRVIKALQSHGIAFIIFGHDVRDWAEATLQLVELSRKDT